MFGLAEWIQRSHQVFENLKTLRPKHYMQIVQVDLRASIMPGTTLKSFIWGNTRIGNLTFKGRKRAATKSYITYMKDLVLVPYKMPKMAQGPSVRLLAFLSDLWPPPKDTYWCESCAMICNPCWRQSKCIEDCYRALSRHKRGCNRLATKLYLEF